MVYAYTNFAACIALTLQWHANQSPQPFNGKQALLPSASPWMIGGNRGLWSLRVPFEHLGARIYPDMFSLAQAHEAFNESGSIANTTLQEGFEPTIGCFTDLVEAAKHYPTLKKQWVEFPESDPMRKSTASKPLGRPSSAEQRECCRTGWCELRTGVTDPSTWNGDPGRLYSTVTDFARFLG